MADDIEFVPLFPNDTEETILARMRAWANEGLDPLVDGDRWVDTREGAHWHLSVRPSVIELARLYSYLGTEVVMAAFPVWAWGQYLDDHAEVQDIVRLAATPAVGEVVFSGPDGTVIAAGTTVGVEPVAADEDTPEFEVTTGGTIPGVAAAPAGLASAAGVGGTLVGAGGGGTTYGYKVTSIDEAGETTPTAEDTQLIGAGVANGSVTLTWDPVATATGYRVYGRTNTGPWGLLATVTAETYIDTGAVAPGAAPPGANTTGGELRLPIRAVEAGVAGNVGAGAITEPSTPLDPGVTFTNPEATTDGTEPETDDALRERVLEALTGQGAGNRRDYVRWTSAFDGVGRVTVIPVWDGPDTVKVIAMGPGGDPLSDEKVAEIQFDLDPDPARGSGTAPIGHVVTVVTATARPIDIEATIEFEAGYSLDGDENTIAKRADILRALGQYVERVEPGGEVVVAQLGGRIAVLTGVHDAQIDELEGVGPAVNVAIDDDPAEAPTLGIVTLVEGVL